MAKTTFFPVDRSILEHWLWKDRPFSKGQAWLDLLLLANYADKKTIHRGQVVECKRGDVNLSLLELSKRWGWDRSKVKRFLAVLEADGMVSVNATTKRTTVTIENYSVYNNSATTDPTTDPTTDITTDITTDAHQTPQQTHITKKEKKEKKIKREKTIKSVLELAPPEMVPALRDFIEMRQTIKAPLTARALELLIGKVNKLSGGDTAKSIDILNQSIENGWKGVYEIKANKAGNDKLSDKLADSYDMLADWATGGD